MINPIILRSKRKTLALYVIGSGNVEVRSPLQLPDLEIQKFVEKHREWINKRQKELGESSSKPKTYTEGSLFYFLGFTYPLIIKPLSHPPLSFDGASFILSKTHRDKAKDLFMSWYKREAIRLIKDHVEALSKQYNLKFKGVKITNAKSRWGSCNGKNNLSFSLRLVLAPVSVIDYVVVHELAHTLHHNHSKSFWREVSRYCPNYKVERKWLKQHGHKLTL